MQPPDLRSFLKAAAAAVPLNIIAVTIAASAAAALAYWWWGSSQARNFVFDVVYFTLTVTAWVWHLRQHPRTVADPDPRKQS